MDNETWKLIIAHLTDEQDAVAAMRVREWLSKDPLHEQQLEQARWIWMGTAGLPESKEWKDSFKAISATIRLPAEEIKEPVVVLKPVQHSYVIGKRWMAIAAVLTGLAVFISFFRYQEKQVIKPEQLVWVTKHAEAGKMLNLVLPDGSALWLNSGSTVRFPKNMKQAGNRTVQLDGEAFFDVKPDAAHPFVVHSQQIHTRVLGTSFNIKAWPGGRAEVAVLTGKVAVSKDSAGRESAAVQLIPGQMAVSMNRSAKLYREQLAEISDANAWMSGKISFNQTPMETVFAALERKYNVHIKVVQAFSGCKLTASFGNVNLSEVMETLKVTLALQYQIKGETVYIKGGKCN